MRKGQAYNNCKFKEQVVLSTCKLLNAKCISLQQILNVVNNKC